MKNVLLMLRVQLSQMLGLNRILRIRDRKLRRRKLATYLFVAIAMCALLPTITMYLYFIASGFSAAGMLGLFPGMVCMLGGLVTLITSIPVASGALYGAKDYELILALPVRDEEVAASRTLAVYAVDLLFTAAVMLPAGGIYAWFAKPEAWFYPVYVLLTIASPMIPLIIGCAVGALTTKLTASFPGAKYIRMLLLTAATMGIWWLSMASAMRGDTDEAMMGYWTDMAKTFGDVVNRAYPPAALFSSAAVDGNAGALAAFLALSAALFAGFSMLIGKSLRHMNTLLTTSRTHGKYRLREMRAASPVAALYKKELRRYFGSVIYVFNTGFGLLMLLTFAVLLVTMGGKYIPVFSMALAASGVDASAMPLLGTLIAAFMLSTAAITASSISMEGRQLWIIKSAPVSGMTILLSKLLVHLTMTVPVSLLFGAALIAAFHPTLGISCLCLTVPAVYALFIGVLGLAINLKSHSFDWQTDTAVVKQSAAVSLTMLVGVVTILIPVALFFFVKLNAVSSATIFALLVALASAALLQWMRSYGDNLILAL